MKIVILYCGSSQIKPLLDKCASLDVTPVVLVSDAAADEIIQLNPKGIIISGSPRSVLDPHAPAVDPSVYTLGLPVLGICYGMQRMAKDLGGDVVRFPIKEEGEVMLSLDKMPPSALFEGFTKAGANVWMSHALQVREMPHGFVKTSESELTFFSSMERGHLYATQFHPEKRGSGAGAQILNNFFTICGGQDA